MIGGEWYVIKFWQAVGFKELGAITQIYDQGSYLKSPCHGFHDIPVVKSYIKLLTQPKLIKKCSVCLTGPRGRKSITIQFVYDREHTLQTYKKFRVKCF